MKFLLIIIITYQDINKINNNIPPINGIVHSFDWYFCINNSKSKKIIKFFIFHFVIHVDDDFVYSFDCKIHNDCQKNTHIIISSSSGYSNGLHSFFFFLLLFIKFFLLIWHLASIKMIILRKQIFIIYEQTNKHRIMLINHLKKNND